MQVSICLEEFRKLSIDKNIERLLGKRGERKERE
jgi:hypothetical protein